MRGNAARRALVVIVISFENNDPVPLPASIPSRRHRQNLRLWKSCRYDATLNARLRRVREHGVCVQLSQKANCHAVAVGSGYGAIEWRAAPDSSRS
jgi:hypothetical protein